MTEDTTSYFCLLRLLANLQPDGDFVDVDRLAASLIRRPQAVARDLSDLVATGVIVTEGAGTQMGVRLTRAGRTVLINYEVTALAVERHRRVARTGDAYDYARPR